MKFEETESILDTLKRYDTPTICNAIEVFGIRPKTEGFCDPSLRAIFDSDTTLVGYAVTAKISAINPPTEQEREYLFDYYLNIEKSVKPVISVLEDIDKPCTGSFWGEVQANTHLALGCIGTITNGGVRDLKEVEELDFYYLAGSIMVSHAYVHIVQYDCPVLIGGLQIFPGDLIHADRHGATVIPQEIVPQLSRVCEAVLDAEQILIRECKKTILAGEYITSERIKKLRQEMTAKRNSSLSSC